MMDWLAFKTPERLWVLLVLPALIIAYLVLMRLKGRTSLRYTNTGVLGRVIGSQRRWTRHLAVFMSLCSLVALTLAWAQPLGTEKVPRERATVVMVIDTSLSMQASDVDPNRLEAAKTAAKQFVDALPDSYKSPMDQQGVRLTVGIPILDWGRGKGKLQMARSSYEIAKVQAAQSQEEFTQNVYLQVMRYSLLPAQLELAAKADTIAQNRYRITKERFLIGKVDVLELDKAQVDRDAARVAYTRSLLSYWQTYYALRQLALYDPNTDRELDIEPELNGLIR